MRSDSPRRIRIALAAGLALAALAALAPAARAQSYGLGDQVTTLGSMEFRPLTNTTAYTFNPPDGYVYGQGDYLAPLRLPDGAEIFQLCVYANVPNDVSFVSTYLTAWRLAPAGVSGARFDIPGTQALHNLPIGNADVCSEPFSYIFHDTFDVDGDQSPEHIFHGINAVVVGDSGLGGMRVYWRRRVRVGPGTPTFNDVPVLDAGYRYIEALVSSGVTAGCGNGNYCPDAPITRRQMAVFLAKALGMHFTE
jgi:hypothetical protein